MLMRATPSNKWKFIAEFALVAIIVALGAYPRLVGIQDTGIAEMQPDEARIGLGAASIIHYRTPIFNYGSPHEPPLSLYYPIPFILLFGRGLWVLKLAPILFALGAIVLTYLAGKEMFSIRVGAVSAVFLALLPFSVCFSRILYEHSFLPFYMAGALYFYARHLKTGYARPLYVCAALMGLALSTKIIVIYYVVAFLFAVAVSGREMRPRIGVRQTIFTCLFFLLGASPFIALLFLSNSFFSILSETRGGGIGTAAAVVEAMRLRLVMSEEAFTPVVRYALAIWAIIFVIREKVEQRVVFLFVLCAALLCMSIVTVSGLGIYHMMVFLPAPMIFAASLVDLPVDKSVAAAWALAACTAAALIVFLWIPALNGRNLFQAAGVNEMTTALESMAPTETLPSQKDIKMIQSYLHYRKNGELPPLANDDIVSTECNRYRRCNGRAPLPLFADFDSFYRKNLENAEKTRIPWNAYSQPGFFTPARAKIFEDTLLDLAARQGYRYLVIGLITQPGHPFLYLNRQLEIAVDALSKKGELRVKQTVYENRHTAYKIIEMTPD